MWLSKSTVNPLFALLAIGAVITGTNAGRRGRIMGGGLATNSEFTGTVKLTVLSGYTMSNCGAGIISRRHILTAAHCVDVGNIDSIQVRAGVHDIEDSSYAVDRYVTKYFVHPNYVRETFFSTVQNDIALLVLASDLPLGRQITVFNLPTSPPNNWMYYKTAGWGYDRSYARTIQRKLKTLNMILCPSNVLIPEHTLCAQSYSGATCSGDSGSALISGSYIYGIVSAGQCRTGGMTIFTDVYAFRNWIINIIRENPN